jgi:hypothetical protein
MENGLQTIRNDIQVAPAAMQASTSLAQIEQSRAVAEVQAAMVLARANRRDEQHSEYRIMQSCKRKSLAECASYSFRRGGDIVTGPSIRLAEEIARHWGNMQYGFREIGRSEESSEVEAFAHDLETNVRVTRQFQVRHWRDTKSGGKKITEERDKYELIANQAQRRVRACLLELVPGDIVEAAEEACKATLMSGIKDIPAKVKEIVAAFAPIGVTGEMIEGYLQRKLTSIVPADIVNLQRIYRSIRDGVAAVDEFFKAEDVAKLNERFGGNGSKSAEKKPPAKPPEQQTSPEQPPHQEEEQKPEQPANDPATDMKTKSFIKELMAKTSSLEIDQWRMKHSNRVANTFGGTDSPGYLYIMDLANLRFSELEEVEKQQQPAENQGGNANGSLF